MVPPLIQQQLREGIQAVRQGDRRRGAALLLQVVAADECNEPAWLWLSQAVTAPVDQLVALEHALRLNPDNDAARAQVQALREQLGFEPPIAPPESPASESPPLEIEPAALPAAVDDAFDNDPDQCLYCGKLTEPDAGHCPYCHRSLLEPGPTETAASYRWLILFSAANLQLNIVLPGLALAKVVLQSGNVSAFVYSASSYTMLGHMLLWLAAFLVIVSSPSAAALAATAFALVDISFSGASLALGWTSPQLAAILAVLDLLLVGLGCLMLLNSAAARVRRRVILDRNAYGHAELYRRGRRYAREGKWALAALHLQKAMVLKPAIAEYYKDLSFAQAQLGRYPQALRTLRAGLERLPEDSDFPAQIAALEARLASFLRS